uniref:Uncharacterized protein n=1 Tax=Oryza punctata TaxID=4537 RepID=A0A0E0KU27_ORYPU
MAHAKESALWREVKLEIGSREDEGFNKRLGFESDGVYGHCEAKDEGRTRLGRKKGKWTPIAMHASSEMSCLTIVPKPESSSHEKH